MFTFTFTATAASTTAPSLFTFTVTNSVANTVRVINPSQTPSSSATPSARLDAGSIIALALGIPSLLVATLTLYSMSQTGGGMLFQKLLLPVWLRRLLQLRKSN